MKTHLALEFLNYLDPSPDARFTIEHYTDLPEGAKKPIPDPLSGQHNNLSLQDVERLLPKLHEVNERGAGIYVARNAFTGKRKEVNLSRVRGIHADMDKHTEAQLAQLMTVLPPSIIVQSSGANKLHLYWQLTNGETLTKDEAKRINQLIVKKFGADKAAVDTARLLRVAGFKHMKYRGDGKTPTVTAAYYECVYTADQIRDAFPTESDYISTGEPWEVVAGDESISEPQVMPHQLEAVAKSVAARHEKLWAGKWAEVIRSSGEIGYSSKSEADLALAGHIVRACQAAGLNTTELPGCAEAVFSSSPMGQDSKWQGRADYRARTIEKSLNSVSALAASVPTRGLQLESHGDIRNSKAFAQVSRGKFLYVSSRKCWLCWTEGRWILCVKNEHIAHASEVCNQILNAATTIYGQDQERGKRLISEAMASHKHNRILAMLALAVAEPGMSVTDSELDGDPYKLGVKNGVIDLRTGRLHFNQPEDYITRQCGANFDAAAECPQWLTFLAQIFNDDKQTIESTQRLLGYTLLGLATEEILVICHGYGSNGKSVFGNVVYKIMGGYAITAAPSLLKARRSDDTGPRDDLAALAGSRYVSINELQAGDRLDEQIVKMLAGREPISARFLYGPLFEFWPSFTAWLRTNHKPKIIGVDDGIWRRLVMLPFSRKFSDEEKDPNLEHKLLAEKDGILMWMIEGARLYLKDGIRQSPRMLAELSSYRSESDLLGEFLSDRTRAEPLGKVPQQTLYNAYTSWCKESGVRPLARKNFTQRLAERGFTEGRSAAVRFYLGLALSETVLTITMPW